MSDTNLFNTRRERLIIPALGPFYASVAQPLAFTVLRVAVGLGLLLEGYPKILNPMGMVGFVESLGFAPGWFWSPLLAALQFFGGIMLALGLLTRPVALSLGVMLFVTLYFHFISPYPPAILTDAGVAALTGIPELFAESAVRRLGDGGAAFMAQVQEKALFNSLYWGGATMLFAAFGGGKISLDRLFKKEF